ncbi:MAG: 50S ribosomal protein L29 [Bacteroidetes bacterium RIFCSPLOWO2_02_FULL_36_8]|nr:MAG: 50S ribosomal protein L29 [Bacteroidetes bacterium RIFCSPLOWO2_02_FULL_36_8]OFY69404.1 MAG: 50S ribosomal protein L29 [Bacteroidetes bacterium RIFCSPLOWO2_12_FULL_37_12]
MKNSDIRLLTEQEIDEKISSEMSNLQKFRFAHAVSPVENPSSIKKTKRLIARLHTELRTRELKEELNAVK